MRRATRFGSDASSSGETCFETTRGSPFVGDHHRRNRGRDKAIAERGLRRVLGMAASPGLIREITLTRQTPSSRPTPISLASENRAAEELKNTQKQASAGASIDLTPIFPGAIGSTMPKNP
jgi:hypothetical protein